MVVLGVVDHLAGKWWAAASALLAWLALRPAGLPRQPKQEISQEISQESHQGSGQAGKQPGGKAGKHVPDDWLDAPPSARELTGHASQYPRQVGHWSEIGMGGPMCGDILLPDGAILRGISEQGGVDRIGDGPLYVGSRMGRGGETALVYDSASRRVHDPGLPLGTPLARLLAACAADPAPVQLYPVLGLWLDREVVPPARTLERRLPGGRLLRATLLLPDDLRGAAEPEEWVTLAPYRLDVDGRPTRIHLYRLDDCAESPSGDAFAVCGARLNRDGAPLWHIGYRGEFHTVAAWGAEEGDISCSLDDVSLADGGVVSWRVACTRWEDFRRKTMPPPSSVDVRVHWVDSPLSLPVRDGMVTIRLPETLPPAALRYWG